MKYSVIWLRSAERELAELWVNAPNRAAITDAATQIDHRLEVDPSNEGESRDNGRRILLIAPLAVKFRVDERTRSVRVSTVWRFTRRLH